MANKFKIVGFAGSLRKDSYNKALLRAAAELLPKNVELEIFDLEGIPPYNQDLDNSRRQGSRSSRPGSGLPMPSWSPPRNTITPCRVF